MSRIPEPVTPELTQALCLEGERIYLRTVVESDATTAYAGWLNDPETTKFMASGSQIETVHTLEKYIRHHAKRTDVLFLAIILREGKFHVGNIKLEPINWRHRSATLGIMIGESSARGTGVGTEAIRLVLRHAFVEMKLHRVALGVTADNTPGIRCYEKAGFRREGVFREAVLREKDYIDSYWMAILAHEYEETQRSAL